MKIALIANLRALAGNQNLAPVLEEKASKQNRIRFDLLATQYHGQAIEIMKQLSIHEYDTIVSMGGDGTNYQVLNGMLKYQGEGELPAIGILPVGRGNSFARDLQILSLADGIAALGRRTTRNVDVCYFSQKDGPHYFVNLSRLS